MKRGDLPPVPQLSLIRKKSQQVPTNEKGDKSPSLAYTYTGQQSQSASRLTINSISRVQSAAQYSRVSNSSINRDAYLMEPLNAPSTISYSHSRISNISQQSSQYISESLQYAYQQNYYVPQMLNSIQNDRQQIQLQLKTQLLIKDIDMKELLFKQRMRKLLGDAIQYEKELQLIAGEEYLNQKSIIQLNELKNQSMQLGRSCVFEMEKLLNAH